MQMAPAQRGLFVFIGAGFLNALPLLREFRFDNNAQLFTLG